MLITALCVWLTRSNAEILSCTGPTATPVAPASRLHADSAHPCTLPALAARSGLSRAHLARRFNALDGRPMTYLGQRRLALAAELLREPDTVLAMVADRGFEILRKVPAGSTSC
jgi:AraC-like DNA-binding protein